jgi:hypothetical protein
MNSPHVNTARLVALAAAFFVTAIEWTGFSEILRLTDSSQTASVQAADVSPDGALPEVVVTAQAGR